MADQHKIRERAYSIWEDAGRPDGQHEDHWQQAEREGDGEEIPSMAAIREAAREHTDAFLVETDIEDADQREATPGVREQD